ncbi:MAG TPA: ECF-type sigma factor, partial [Blastocatellia bacterium]
MNEASPNEITGRLIAWREGDAAALEQLIPAVYQELRRMAERYLRSESSGHTLQPTALVHEAYLRLVDVNKAQEWNSRGHFFGAAAEAMRRILVERARSKRRVKRGGGA